MRINIRGGREIAVSQPLLNHLHRDTVCQKQIVKSRFLKINSGHLEYVFDCIDKNTTKVGNIKAYLLAALYNAPATMDSYYRAEVNHDLYGC